MTRSTAVAAAACAAVLQSGCHHSTAPTSVAETAPPVVNLSGWVDEIGPNTASDFEKRTGIRVNIQALTANQVLLTQLLTGHSGLDVVEPSSNFVPPAIAAGALLKLDRSRLPHWKNLDPKMLHMMESSDPGNQYTVPFVWTSEGVLMNPVQVAAALGKSPPHSMRLIFDPALASRLEHCGIVWQESAWTVSDWARLYLHIDTQSENLDDLAAVEKVLTGGRPYVRYFDNFRGHSELSAGELCLDIAEAGSALQALKRAREAGRNVQLEFFVPAEGGLLALDTLAIPADAPHIDAAYRFIDYLLEAQVIADVTNATGFANANAAATPLVKPEIRDNPWIYPPPEVLARLHIFHSESPEFARLENRMWTRVRTLETQQ